MQLGGAILPRIHPSPLQPLTRIPIDVTLLLTRADYDAVTTELDKRLRLLDNREENFGYQDEVGSDRAEALTQELSGLNSRVPFLTTSWPPSRPAPASTPKPPTSCAGPPTAATSWPPSKASAAA